MSKSTRRGRRREAQGNRRQLRLARNRRARSRRRHRAKRRPGCVLSVSFLGKLALQSLAKAHLGSRAKQAKFDSDGCLAALVLRAMLGLATLGALVDLLKNPSVSLSLGFARPLTFRNPLTDVLKRLSVPVADALLQGVLKAIVSVSGVQLGLDRVCIDSTFLVVHGKTYERARRGYSSLHKRKLKGYRLQVAYDSRTRLPLALHLTPGNRSDHKSLKPLVHRLESVLGDRKPVLVMDRGYASAAAYRYLHRKGFPFVIRTKSNPSRIKGALAAAHASGFTRRAKRYRTSHASFTLSRPPLTLRLVVIRDDAFAKPLLLVTNKLDWSDAKVHQAYRGRARIESFFKELRQRWNLNTFLGTSWNQVVGHVYTTLIGYAAHQALRLFMDHTRRRRNVLYFRDRIYNKEISDELLNSSLRQLTRRAPTLAALLKILFPTGLDPDNPVLMHFFESRHTGSPLPVRP